MQTFNSYCQFRYPGENCIHRFKGNIKLGFLRGFVIAPFDPEDELYTITDLKELSESDSKAQISLNISDTSVYPFPEVSTSEEAHLNLVKEIKDILKGDLEKKIIASKVIVKSGRIDIKKSFESLCKAFPQAFIFYFSTPQTGTWIGASPELLLKCKNSDISTFALAGTRPADTLAAWDEKNYREHDIVKNYIVDIFKSSGLPVQVSETTTRNAGNIEHLLTEINSHLDASNDIEKLIRDLSPTPALAGNPKDVAIDTIKKLEKYPRGYYGGFVGFYNMPEDCCFYVNLRSLRLEENRYCMYVGGGITALSDPQEEWIETERKAGSILSQLKIC